MAYSSIRTNASILKDFRREGRASVNGRSKHNRGITWLHFGLAVVLSIPISTEAQPASASHEAKATDPVDRNVLLANGDTLDGLAVSNSCGSLVHPGIGFPAPGVAVVTEVDPTGSCSGSSPPETLTVLLLENGKWRVSTSTTGKGFTIQKAAAGHPDIVVQDPPLQRNCPVLAWTNQGYRPVSVCSAPPDTDPEPGTYAARACSDLAGTYWVVEGERSKPFLRVSPNCRGSMDQDGVWKSEPKVGMMMSPSEIREYLKPASSPRGASGVTWGEFSFVKVPVGWSSQGFTSHTGYMMLTGFGASELKRME